MDYKAAAGNSASKHWNINTQQSMLCVKTHSDNTSNYSKDNIIKEC